MARACPWRIRNLRGDGKVKQNAAVHLPQVLTDVDYFSSLSIYWGSSIPTRMSPMPDDVMALIVSELVLQISRSLKEYVIKQLAPDATD